MVADHSKAVLDVGLARRPPLVANVFAVMKGVADGGINVPHRTDSSVMIPNRKSTMPRLTVTESLCGVSADSLEEMYKKAHAAIRANPDRKPREAKKYGEQKRFTAKKDHIGEEKGAHQREKKHFFCS
ncbi:hypothetical protein KIN20_024195 [Parelaphostrongylus tenuis]|uniref:Large ribosomal subunit protein uL18 n=1 Tax=Parelaphostrongylus tenuis TaxID=148309 RepID=A0AAD5MT12_PARTN|nr:hypothetical protein KIN20_024195 [Parelaphostrongylus tenuis]